MTATSAHNIVLVGFMATGKTLISNLLSERLDYKLIDLDTSIVEDAGKPITDIFAQDGEPAFRDMETVQLKRLLLDNVQRCVISTGGGIVVRDENKALMKRVGKVVLLKASVDEILRRTDGDTERPLLQTPDKRARVEDLLDKRREHYESAADVIIETTGVPPDDVVDQIIQSLID